MSRLRGKPKSLLWLVLLAWMFQLPLAALHSHSFVRAGAAASTASVADQTRQLPSPDDKDHDGDICPICWSIATTSSALTAPPPSVPPPPSLAAPDHPVLARVAAPQAKATAFDARGPPRVAETLLNLG